MSETTDSNFIFIFKLGNDEKVATDALDNDKPYYCIEGAFSVNNNNTQITGNITTKHSNIDPLTNSDKYLLVFRSKDSDNSPQNKYYKITNEDDVNIPDANNQLTLSIAEYTDILDEIQEGSVIIESPIIAPEENDITESTDKLAAFDKLFANTSQDGGADNIESKYKNLQTHLKDTLTHFLMDPFILKLNSLSTDNLTFKSNMDDDILINLEKKDNVVSHISITDFIRTVVAPFVYISLTIDIENFQSALDDTNNEIDDINYSKIVSVKTGGAETKKYIFHIYRFLKLFDKTYENPKDTQQFQYSLFPVIKNVCDKMNDMKKYIEFIREKDNDHVVKAIDANLAKQNNNNILVMLKINNFDHGTKNYNHRFDVNVETDNKSMLLKYNDDNFSYYQDPPTNNQNAGNVLITSEYIKTFCNENYPAKRQDGGDLTTFVDTKLKDKLNLQDQEKEYQFTINNYDHQYLLGNYHEIYTPDLNNSDIAEKMNIIVDQLVEKRKPVFILGYGASGAGKTSSLIYFNKAKEDGILIHLCNILGANHKYSDLTVQTKEYFQVNPKDEDAPDGGICEGTDNGGKKQYTCTLADYQFTYGGNNWTRADKNQSQTIHNYRPGSESMADPTGQSLGETLIHIIDTDRFVKATTNNPNSSRSHVVVHLKFTKNDNTKPAFLFVGDFAGVENKFTCNSVNTQRQFLNVENDDGKTYYGQKLHGGYDGPPRDTVFQSVNENADMSSVLKDDKLFDWLNPTMTKTLQMDMDNTATFNMNDENLKHIIKNYFPIKLNMVDDKTNKHTFTYRYNEYKSLESMVDALKTITQSQSSSLRERFNIIVDNAITSIVSGDSASPTYKKTSGFIDTLKTLFGFNRQIPDINQNTRNDHIRALIRDLYFDRKEKFDQNVQRAREYVDDYTVNNLFRDEVIDNLINGTQTDYMFYIPNVRYKGKPIVVGSLKLEDKVNSNLTQQQQNFRHGTGFLKKTRVQVISDLINHYYFMFARVDKANYYLYNDDENRYDISTFFNVMYKEIDYVSSCVAFFGRIATIHNETVKRLDYAKEICNNRVVEGEFINDSLSKVRQTIAYILSKKSENVIFNSPDFINECLTQYCKPGDFCFQVENSDKQSDQKQSEIFEDMFSFINDSEDNSESKELFYKDIVVSIFGVLNISRKANNPPPVPYIDINELKRLYYSYQNTESEKILAELKNALAKVSEFSKNKTVVANWSNYIKGLEHRMIEIKKNQTQKQSSYVYEKQKSSTPYEITESYKSIEQSINTYLQPLLDKRLRKQILEVLNKINTQITKKNNPIENLTILKSQLTNLKSKLTNLNSKSTILKNIDNLIKYLTIHFITIPGFQKDIQHISSLITQANRYLYDSQPDNMNTQINVDMSIVNSLQKPSSSDENKEGDTSIQLIDDVLQHKRDNDSKLLVELFIDSVDTNNAISAVGTLEFLDRVSKFNVPNNLCKIDPPNGSNYKALY